MDGFEKWRRRRKQCDRFQSGEDEEGQDYFDLVHEVHNASVLFDEEYEADEQLTANECRPVIKHYKKYMKLRTCASKYGIACTTNERRHYSLQITTMDQAQHMNAVTAMLFAFSAS